MNRTNALLIAGYLAAIVAANLSVTRWGPPAGEIYPFASVDSTDVGRNHNRVSGDVVGMASRWDGMQCPSRWEKVEQLELDWSAPRTSGGQPMEGVVV